MAWLLLDRVPASLRQRFRKLGSKLVWLALSVDESIAYCGRLVGAGHRTVAGQFWHFATVYAAGYLLAVVPISVLERRGIEVPSAAWAIALASLSALYFGVIAVWRSWDQDERRRAKIFPHRDQNGRPDDSPDLRYLAVLAAMQLVVLCPLILWCLDGAFGLFPIPVGEGPTPFHNRVWFVLQALWHAEPISDSILAAAVITLMRLTVAYVLVQGVIRTVLICRDVREAVVAFAVKNDRFQDLLQIGRGCVPHLCRCIEGVEEIQIERHQLTEAFAILGVLRDPRALKTLVDHLRGVGDAAKAAYDAIFMIGGAKAVDALLDVLKPNVNHAEPFVRRVLDALGELKDPRAIREVVRWLKDRRQSVQESANAAFDAIVKMGGRKVVDALLEVLRREESADVTRRVVSALRELKDPRAIRELARRRKHEKTLAVCAAKERAISSLKSTPTSRRRSRKGAKPHATKVFASLPSWKVVIFVSAPVLVVAVLFLISWQWPLWARQP